MNVAAIIIGIEGWERYTLPLIESIQKHEPRAGVITIDNASKEPYPTGYAHRCDERLCYANAINAGGYLAKAGNADWYIVLSNDVLCTGPFAHILAEYDASANAIGGADLVGPCLKEISIEHVGNVPYIEGWCICVPHAIWSTLGGFDEGMEISSYEDVEYSHRARLNGFGLVEDTSFPFVHLDQQQRFYLVPDYWSSEHHNRARFIEKYGQKVRA